MASVEHWKLVREHAFEIKTPDADMLVWETTHTPKKPTECQACHHEFHIEEIHDILDWTIRNLSCPACKEEFCPKPDSERELFKIQDKFFIQGRNVKYLGELYTFIWPYVSSLAYKKYGGLMSDDNHEEFVEECVSQLMEQYLKKPRFKITGSFSGFFRYKFMQIYIPELHDEEESIHKTDSEGDEFIQIAAPDQIDHKDNIAQKYKLVRDIIEIGFKRSRGSTEIEHLLKNLGIWHTFSGRGTDSFIRMFPEAKPDHLHEALSSIQKKLSQVVNG